MLMDTVVTCSSNGSDESDSSYSEERSESEAVEEKIITDSDFHNAT